MIQNFLTELPVLFGKNQNAKDRCGTQGIKGQCVNGAGRECFFPTVYKYGDQGGGTIAAVGSESSTASSVSSETSKPESSAASSDPETSSEAEPERFPAPDFTVPVYGTGETFTLSEYRGKTVVVNFWATWCTPCCEELPYFDQLHQEYGDKVTVVAIHSDLVTDDIDAYLAQFDYTMPFALDETGEVANLLGVGNMLPQTIVINADGVITYNAAGSLNYETLLSLTKQ